MDFSGISLVTTQTCFTATAIYFSCAHGVRSDDLINPPHSSKFDYKGDFQRSGFDFKLRDKLNWSIYSELVSSYTSRQMTNEADAIPAFTALSNVLGVEIFGNSPFVSGLPFSSIDAALLWRRCLGCESCKNTSRGLAKRGGTWYVKASPYAPSWSWAGWVGHVHYSSWILASENPAWSVIPKVSWLEVKDGSQAKVTTWRSPSHSIMSGWMPTYRGYTLWDEKSDVVYSQPVMSKDFENRNLVHPVTRHLHLEADVAEFIVAGKLFRGLQSGRETGNYVYGDNIAFGGSSGDPLALHDCRNKFRCGVVYNDLALSTLGIEMPCLASFIKLSQTTMSETFVMDPPHALDNVLSDSSTREILSDSRDIKPDKLHNFFDYEKYDCSDRWCLYNVLMVCWSGDVAFRIGVGKIHVEAFDNASDLKHKRFYLG
jgi:hypothetical protein